ncbi:MAG: pentapeptide repeat-containing protein [Candidatus Thiodiazotropha sp.]|nr:pentapeptide repeat-containing protein [Candidatus Thiodiazotropha sp.]
MELDDVEFKDCLFDHANLEKNDLNKVRFINCSMIGVIMTSSMITECSFDDCEMMDASFDQAYFRATKFHDVEVKDINFSQAQLDGPTISSIMSKEGQISRVIIRDTDISDMTIQSFKLFDCQFESVNFDNITFMDTLMIDCRFPMSRFKHCSFNDGCKTDGGTFSLAHFEMTSFNNMHLDKATRFYSAKMDVFTLESLSKVLKEVFGVKLVTEGQQTGAQLGDATYLNCDFSDTDFKDAWLYKARFFLCNFSSAKFTGANLILSQFHQCNLSSAWFSWVRIHAAIFRRCDFRKSDWRLNLGYYPAFYDCDFTDANGNWKFYYKDTKFPHFSKANFLKYHNAFNCPNFEDEEKGVFIEPHEACQDRAYPIYAYRYDILPGQWDLYVGRNGDGYKFIPDEFGPNEGKLTDNCKHLHSQSRVLFSKQDRDIVPACGACMDAQSGRKQSLIARNAHG